MVKNVRKNGILTMLDEDYDLLHGHGFEYVIHDIEKVLASSVVSEDLPSGQRDSPLENVVL